MNSIPLVYNELFTDDFFKSLKLEAAKRFRELALPTKPEAWYAHRKNLLGKIRQKLGLAIDHNLPLDYTVTGSVACEGYRIDKITYQSMIGHCVTGNLYVPDGEGPFPAIINMHGHWAQGRLAARVQSRGHLFAKHGYVVLCVDAFGSGERAIKHGEFEYHGNMLGGSLLNLGETLMGHQVVDNMRGVDLLQSLPFVQRDKIGATGASGGGNQTMYLAALDERIQAAVPVCSVGSYESYIGGTNCVCELLPDGLTFTEESGLLAMASPRALKIINGLHDANPTFHVSEMMRSFDEARKVYRGLECDEKLSYQAVNTPHAYSSEAAGAALGWFNLHLKGIGHGAPCVVAQFDEIPESALFVFEPGKRPPEVESIIAYRTRKGVAAKTAAAAKKRSADQARKELTELLRFSPECTFKTAIQLDDQDNFERYIVRGADGRTLPALFRRPCGNEKKVIILTAPRGKQELLGSALYQRFFDSSCGLVLFDPTGSGENCSSELVQGRLADFHQHARALIWLGRRLMGEFASDYLLTQSWLSSVMPHAQIEFAGLRDSALAALFAAGACEKAIDISLESAPVSLHFAGSANEAYLSLACCIPNFLIWGDVMTAAALSGGSVCFHQPCRCDGKALDAPDKQQAKTEFEFWKEMFALGGSCIFAQS